MEPKNWNTILPSLLGMYEKLVELGDIYGLRKKLID